MKYPADLYLSDSEDEEQKNFIEELRKIEEQLASKQSPPTRNNGYNSRIMGDVHLGYNRFNPQGMDTSVNRSNQDIQPFQTEVTTVAFRSSKPSSAITPSYVEESAAINSSSMTKNSKPEMSPEEEKNIDRQIFSYEQRESSDFEIEEENNTDSSKFVTSFKSLRSTFNSYKKDAKNLFLGEFLSQCGKKRKSDDNWYFWSKEMISGLEKNDASVKEALLTLGHEKISEIFEKGNGSSSNGNAEWNCTLDSKVSSLLNGLKSIDNLIKTKGMQTVWGNIKYEGIIKNSIKNAKSKILNNEDKVKDILDYLKYKRSRWDKVIRKNKENMKRNKSA